MYFFFDERKRSPPGSGRECSASLIPRSALCLVSRLPLLSLKIGRLIRRRQPGFWAGMGKPALFLIRKMRVKNSMTTVRPLTRSSLSKSYKRSRASGQSLDTNNGRCCAHALGMTGPAIQKIWMIALRPG